MRDSDSMAAASTSASIHSLDEENAAAASSGAGLTFVEEAAEITSEERPGATSEEVSLPAAKSSQAGVTSEESEVTSAKTEVTSEDGALASEWRETGMEDNSASIANEKPATMVAASSAQDRLRRSSNLRPLLYQLCRCLCHRRQHHCCCGLQRGPLCLRRRCQR